MVWVAVLMSLKGLGPRAWDLGLGLPALEGLGRLDALNRHVYYHYRYHSWAKCF